MFCLIACSLPHRVSQTPSLALIRLALRSYTEFHRFTEINQLRPVSSEMMGRLSPDRFKDPGFHQLALRVGVRRCSVPPGHQASSMTFSSCRSLWTKVLGGRLFGIISLSNALYCVPQGGYAIAMHILVTRKMT